jgi:hypothetical protein
LDGNWNGVEVGSGANVGIGVAVDGSGEPAVEMGCPPKSGPPGVAVMKRTAGVGAGEAGARPHAANNAPKTMKPNAVIKVRIADPSSISCPKITSGSPLESLISISENTKLFLDEALV